MAQGSAKEKLKAVRARYLKVTREEKGRLLDESFR